MEDTQIEKVNKLLQEKNADGSLKYTNSQIHDMLEKLGIHGTAKPAEKSKLYNILHNIKPKP